MSERLWLKWVGFLDTSPVYFEIWGISNVSLFGPKREKEITYLSLAHFFQRKTSAQAGEIHSNC